MIIFCKFHRNLFSILAKQKEIPMEQDRLQKCVKTKLFKRQTCRNRLSNNLVCQTSKVSCNTKSILNITKSIFERFSIVQCVQTLEMHTHIHNTIIYSQQSHIALEVMSIDFVVRNQYASPPRQCNTGRPGAESL